VLDALRTEPKRPFHSGEPPAEARKILARASGDEVRAGRSFLRRS
jgi:hypothetical protein